MLYIALHPCGAARATAEPRDDGIPRGAKPSMTLALRQTLLSVQVHAVSGTALQAHSQDQTRGQPKSHERAEEQLQHIWHLGHFALMACSDTAHQD